MASEEKSPAFGGKLFSDGASATGSTGNTSIVLTRYYFLSPSQVLHLILNRAGSIKKNAWLVLDRNNNGRIDDGTELFGNFTQQPKPASGMRRNGFAALAVFDDPQNGGNNDGIIDRRDTVYSHLRLWEDTNHDGVSEPSELYELPAAGVAGIDLHYKVQRRMDEHGNQFSFQSAIIRSNGHTDGRFAWDVYLDFKDQ